MSGDRRVRFRILHIIEAAEFVRRTLNGMTFEEFSANRVVVLAMLHSLQIAGEAAGAYARSMASDNNLSGRPAIVVAREGESSLTRKRESFHDLMALDVL